MNVNHGFMPVGKSVAAMPALFPQHPRFMKSGNDSFGPNILVLTDGDVQELINQNSIPGLSVAEVRNLIRQVEGVVLNRQQQLKKVRTEVKPKTPIIGYTFSMSPAVTTSWGPRKA